MLDPNALARIRAAYDPETFRATATRWTELLSSHVSKVCDRQTPVLNWADPEANTAEAERWLDKTLSEPSTLYALPSRRDSTQFAHIVEQMLARGHNLHHPRYIGHQVPAPVPIAGLFDAVGAVTNQVMAIYEMGPWASAVERALVHRLGELIGWTRGAFGGFVTHGASLGNLTALLTARNIKLNGSWERGPSAFAQHAVIVVQADAHYSVARAAGVLGIGTHNVVRAAVDERRKLDPRKLDDQLGKLKSEGRTVVAVSACACATPIGAFDPLRDVAEVCRKHDVWLHVDAAHGGAALFSQRYRHLLDGLEQADSVVWDAHKMMFMPALCAFVLYKDARHRFETFRQEAPYLFDPSAPGMAEYDSGMSTLECTKRAAAYGLWGTWSLFGQRLFADLVDVTFDLGKLFHQRLLATDDFVALHEPECNIVTFRHVPTESKNATPEVLGAFQRELRRQLIESGRFYIVQTNFAGCGALRVTIINPLTTLNDLDELLVTLREIGKDVLNAQTFTNLKGEPEA